ncbi:MAG: Asp/Glu/hydantoin racemase [Candidatus Aminicenantes bacterium]|nr:Asp/Glu/hydantoin racemase [Candidatus Aminicenantes bacterium]
MKVLIINPNSDPEMTAAILRTARKFSRGRFEVDAKSTPGAQGFIETYEDQALSAPGMIKLLKENEKKYDAFIVACHSDPHLDVLKEITTKPVVGIGEASMKLATMLGHRFSVLTDNPHSIPNKEVQARTYHLEGLLASVRAPEKTSGGGEMEMYGKAAKTAVEKDGAEVLVLGCAGLTGMDKKLCGKLDVPILDGVVCALFLAVGFAEAGISTSKVRRYDPKG